MNNNLKLFPYYRSLVSMMAWLPIFFMYFSENLKLNEVLMLEAIYYVSVVILEIPSGYFSDKVGRRITLILSSGFFSFSYFLFGFCEPTFSIFVIAQILLAGGMSFLSGTDTAFYYESLKEVGLEDSYLDKEAKIQTWKQVASAAAVLLGGIIGYYNLSWSYVLSLAFILPALIMCFLFKEPAIKEKKTTEIYFIKQMRSVLSEIKKHELRWILIYSVILFVISHIPYELYQPYLRLLDDSNRIIGFDAAISSGIIFAATRIIGAYAAHKSPSWSRRFGLKSLCIAAVFLQLFIIGVMAAVLHIAVIGIILLRSLSMSAVTAPINAEIAPRVSSSNRATYFSFQSLLSRLSFSGTLATLSVLVGAQDNNWISLSQILLYSLIIGVFCLIPIFLMRSGKLFQVTTNA